MHDLTPRIIPRGLFFVQVPENPSNRNAPLFIYLLQNKSAEYAKLKQRGNYGEAAVMLAYSAQPALVGLLAGSAYP
ncbi:hypothetical protein AB3Z07_26795 (plasmid) [Metabacillus halosaccharovorans]|uniref:hypothetical protein n=1 Tax=Metabacillus halosaccharovorans TaxID=930124 RepID=UPI0034CF94AB